jgi:hypothetical protein
MDTTLLAAIIGGVLGILGTYVAAVVKFRQDLKVEYDKDLRAERIAAYRELWGLTRLFPGSEYKRVDEVTPEVLQKLLHQFYEWYFTQGKGLYLSKDSTDKYREFKVALQNVLKPGELDETFEDSKQDIDLRVKAHELRETVAKDIGTRVKLQGEAPNISR